MSESSLLSKILSIGTFSIVSVKVLRVKKLAKGIKIPRLITRISIIGAKKEEMLKPAEFNKCLI